MEMGIILVIAYALGKLVSNTKPAPDNHHQHGEWVHTHEHNNGQLHYHPNNDINEWVYVKEPPKKKKKRYILTDEARGIKNE